MTDEKLIRIFTNMKKELFISAPLADEIINKINELCENQMHTAEWEPDYSAEDGNFYTCSYCHTSIGFAGEPTIKHCPECGSRMTNYVF